MQRVSLNLFSLHEVSTGFYPELTCRENIFLNGAIPGMRKEEIKNVKNQDLTPFLTPFCQHLFAMLLLMTLLKDSRIFL